MHACLFIESYFHFLANYCHIGGANSGNALLVVVQVFAEQRRIQDLRAGC